MEQELRAIAVHGGAGGRIPEEGGGAEAIQRALEDAIAAADAALDDGASALDAAQAAVVRLEDGPQFNAGRGSVPTATGTVEMDAGLMCGRTLRAGAVALVTEPRNPIAAARLVLEDGAHLLLAGAAADDFARERGARLAEPGYFLGGSTAKPAARGGGPTGRAADHGTVGAVVCDRHGDVAAATSTGGTRGQLPGRIGDSPILGAGVYAENRSAAVSCTGDGERIMRTLLAHRIARAVEAGSSPQVACEQEIRGSFAALGGSGGAIAVDALGNVGMCFNTAVMHRGWRVGRGRPWVAST
jgi:beta-aspartyl-peptidase (threonine type)